MSQFSQALEALIAQNNWTVKDLAEKAEQPESTVYNWLQGTNTPYNSKIHDLAQKWGVPAIFLIEGPVDAKSAEILDRLSSFQNITKESVNEAVIDQIKARMHNMGMNQREFAEHIGAKPGTFSKWITKDNGPPLSEIIKMAAVLQCSIDDLVNNAPLRLTKLPPWLVPLLPDLATAPPHIRKTIKEIVKSSKAIPKGK